MFESKTAVNAQPNSSLDEELGLSTGSKSNYLPQLDGLRAIAFLMVFFFHAPRIPVIQNTSNWLIASYNFLAASGWLGVELFFVLSGFLITSLLLQEKKSYNFISIKFFYIRRAIRIWPVYYPFLITICLIALPIFTQQLPRAIYKEFLLKEFIPLFFFLGNFAFIIDATPINKICSYAAGPAVWPNAALIPFWSLCVEEQFYAFWPILINKLKQPKNLFKLVITICSLSFILRIAFFVLSKNATQEGAHILYYMNTFCHLDPLMIGALIGIAYVYFPQNIQKIRTWYLLSGIILLAVLNFYWAPPICENVWTSVPLLLTSALMFGGLIILSLQNKIIQQCLSQKHLRWLGIISFSMYVFHFFILKIVSFIFTDTIPMEKNIWSWLAIISMSFAITCTMSLLSWIFIESKLKVFRHKFSR